MNLLIKNCKIADIETGTYGNGDIYAAGGKIIVTGDRFAVVDNNLRTINAEGRYAVPGLINLHAHLFGSGVPSKALGKGEEQDKLVKFIHSALGGFVLRRIVAKSARQQLMSGVTTVRCVGDFDYSDVRLRDKINAGKKGARLICCGPAITAPGGHGDGTFAVTPDGEEALRAEVRRHAEKKVDWIKICVTGGVTDASKEGEPGEVKMTLAQIEAVCDEAHKLGLKVAAHVQSPAGMELAVRGGIDTCEHGAPMTDEVAAMLKERGGAVVTTFSPALPLAELDPEVTKLNELCRTNTRAALAQMTECAKQAKEKEIPVGLGTDSSCPLCTQYDMWREMEYFVRETGASRAETLRAATLGNAGILGMADELGSLDAGKTADFVLLDEDPLQSFETFRRPFLVVKEGKAYKGKPGKYAYVERELDKLLAK